MRKGYKKEWELFHFLWKKGFAVARVAGSGSTSMPACDLIAGNKKEKWAIEVKSTKNSKVYINKNQIKELLEFSEKFGLEPVIFVKFFRKGWYLFNLKDLEKKGNFFVCNIVKGKMIK